MDAVIRLSFFLPYVIATSRNKDLEEVRAGLVWQRLIIFLTSLISYCQQSMNFLFLEISMLYNLWNLLPNKYLMTIKYTILCYFRTVILFIIICFFTFNCIYMWPFLGTITEQDKWEGSSNFLDIFNIDTTSLVNIFHYCIIWIKTEMDGK